MFLFLKRPGSAARGRKYNLSQGTVNFLHHRDLKGDPGAGVKEKGMFLSGMGKKASKARSREKK